MTPLTTTMAPGAMVIASSAARAIGLVAFAMFVILVLLPAALVAAGT